MSRRQKYILRHSKRPIFLFSIIGFLIGWFVIGPLLLDIPTEPVVAIPVTVTPTPTPTPEPTRSPKAPQRPTIGNASYYSIDGCIGCNPDRIMANGERLDDTRLTIAYNHAPMNTQVKITNTENGKIVIATVTDTGGFERHGKIADLSVATRDALGCSSTCPIKLEFIN